ARARAHRDAGAVEHASGHFTRAAVVGEVRTVNVDVAHLAPGTAGLDPHAATGPEGRIDTGAVVGGGLVVAQEVAAGNFPAGDLRGAATVAVVDDDATKSVVEEIGIFNQHIAYRRSILRGGETRSHVQRFGAWIGRIAVLVEGGVAHDEV